MHVHPQYVGEPYSGSEHSSLQGCRRGFCARVVLVVVCFAFVCLVRTSPPLNLFCHDTLPRVANRVASLVFDRKGLVTHGFWRCVTGGMASTLLASPKLVNQVPCHAMWPVAYQHFWLCMDGHCPSHSHVACRYG